MAAPKRILMKRHGAIAAAALLSFLLVGIAPAQEQDAEGSKDHPLLSRMPNFYIRSYEEKEFDRYEFQATTHETTGVEGHYYYINYYLREGSKVPSQLQIIRNYENAITKIGGTVLWDNGANQATLKLVRPGKEIWTYVVASYGGTPSYELRIVEKETMKQEVTANADAWLSDIKTTGHAAVYGIYFDTDKADIKPESEPMLEEITKLLRKDESLKLYLVGHTDNTGEFAHNMKLSEARANAVMNELVSKHAIPAARLKAYGVGPLSPVASNRSEDGRAQNRRVELVER
jgi:OOP family OmpA-OmpF porin